MAQGFGNKTLLFYFIHGGELFKNTRIEEASRHLKLFILYQQKAIRNHLK
jgi:hypothetical protein